MDVSQVFLSGQFAIGLVEKVKAAHQALGFNVRLVIGHGAAVSGHVHGHAAMMAQFQIPIDNQEPAS